jgi:hypothetical protein
VALEKYEHDLEFILAEMNKLNYRDGDTYVELIDRDEGVKHFYRYLYERGTYSHWDALEKGFWEGLESKGDDHYLILHECYGPQYHSSAEAAKDEDGYSVFSDYEEALQTYQPDLYQALENANGLCCFDTGRYFNGHSCTKLSDGRVVFTY